MSRLEDAIAAGRFVLTAELLTVNTGGLDAVHERFAPYEDWVDAVNATDNTAAHAHASPLAVAIALKQLGMEPVMQLVCRDRNRLALAGRHRGRGAARDREHLLPHRRRRHGRRRARGAARVRPRQHPAARDRVARCASGTYLSGRKIDPAPRLFLGAVENPGAPPYDYRVDRALKKVRAGARFLQLQVAFEHGAPRALHGRGGRHGPRREGGAPPVDLPRALAEARCASSTRTCRASRCRPR